MKLDGTDLNLVPDSIEHSLGDPPVWSSLPNDPEPDKTPPTTKILKRPKHPITKSKRQVRFKFKANEPGSTFKCSLDKSRGKSCTSPASYRVKKLDEGRHIFRVRAKDLSGNIEDPPVTASFRVVSK